VSAELFLVFATNTALVLLAVAFLLIVVRVIIGPTLPDRIVALDMLVAAAIGFIAVIGIKTGYALYVDIAIALGLVGFLATVSFARFIMTQAERARPEDGAAQNAETER
jgi:multicomponent Na+:H+ antiporter subunit F